MVVQNPEIKLSKEILFFDHSLIKEYICVIMIVFTINWKWTVSIFY
jgi:hypothetical protein